MCPTDEATNKLIVVSSAKKASGSVNSFVYKLPPFTTFKQISLLNVAMTLPVGVNSVCIKIDELGYGIPLAGSSGLQSCTFYVPNNQSAAINWTSKGQFQQTVGTTYERTFEAFNVGVVDELGNAIALPNDWSMVLRIR